MHRVRTKYERLRAWLTALPDDRRTVRLELTEIAALVGGLPRRAGSAEFWTSGSTPRNNWRALGFGARLDERSVVFSRLPAGSGSTGARRGTSTVTYAKLCAVLASLPANRRQITLTFDEIEALIQRRLPAGAWRGGFWRSSHTARRHWQQLGFQAQASYAGLACVAFTQLGAVANATSRCAPAEEI
jgi:hypothetical protein